jgi:hypothetical protein
LLSNPLGATSSSYNFARIAADYFVANGFSLGGNLGYFSTSVHTKTAATGGSTVEADIGSTTGYLIGARLGYAAMFNRTIGIWPRGGLSYLTIGAKSDSGTDLGGGDRVAGTLDVPLVISPLPHVGFLVGPTLDYGFNGTNKKVTVSTTSSATTTNSYDVSSVSIALNAGMFVYF